MTEFELGQIVATPGAIKLCKNETSTMMYLIDRHKNNDWGDIDAEDAKLNDWAAIHGSRLLSVYKVNDEPIWVITEADRSVTTILLPDEY